MISPNPRLEPARALLASATLPTEDLVVLPSGRRSGAGSELVRFAEDHARGRGVRQLYLLTTTAEAFFEVIHE